MDPRSSQVLKLMALDCAGGTALASCRSPPHLCAGLLKLLHGVSVTGLNIINNKLPTCGTAETPAGWVQWRHLQLGVWTNPKRPMCL